MALFDRVITRYYWRGREVKKTRSKNPNRAMTAAFSHMQVNHYGARVAQVEDEETGMLFGEVLRRMSGKVETTYQYDPRVYETRWGFKALLGELSEKPYEPPEPMTVVTGVKP